MRSMSSLNTLSDKEVIEQAIECGFNFALFRMPGDEQCHMYVSERLLSDDEIGDVKGFVIAPFRNDSRWLIPSDYLRTLSLEGAALEKGKVAECPPMPEWYRAGVSEIAQRHAVRGGKTVFACRRDSVCALSLLDAFSKLVAAYPQAFVFCWKLGSDEDAWLGATPELLLDSDGSNIRTMSLAGTRCRQDGVVTPWDDKNVKEQAMVSDFIESAFRSFGIPCHSEPPCILPAGEIEHICTRFNAETGSKDDIDRLVKMLAPTPAVSGFPREEALADIDELEPFDRKYYSGYCGVRECESVMRLFVTLRCLSIRPSTGHCVLYAGGGITSQSVPESEWLEVHAKMNTLAAVLQLPVAATNE